jgi:hypothetical protein
MRNPRRAGTGVPSTDRFVMSAAPSSKRKPRRFGRGFVSFGMASRFGRQVENPSNGKLKSDDSAKDDRQAAVARRGSVLAAFL